jgi:tetratricopeptide (TPR) repeat protein
MRTRFLLPAVLAVLTGAARADINTENLGPAPARSAAAESSTTATSSAAPPSAASAEDARTSALQQRFEQAKNVEAQGQLVQARSMFDAIIADAPDAKGSLREAGLISMELNDYLKADDYFSKLHALVPDYPMAIEALIQANQALKRDAKVEILIEQFSRLYSQGKVPQPYFVRERIKLEGGAEIVITQFFDYHQPRYYAWAADYLAAHHQLKRQLTVNYDPEVTAQMRKDPKLANAEQFLVVDNVMSGNHVVRLDVYQQFLALPDYIKMRTILLEVFTNALKPIDSASVPSSAPAQ